MSTEEYTKITNDLWYRVQTNEESPKEKMEILKKTEELLNDSKFNENLFLVAKVKLIEFKAGKKHDIKKLIEDFHAAARLDMTNSDIYICEAEANLHDGNPAAALECLEGNTAIDPSPEIYSLISLCYRRLQPQNHEKSLEYANKAVKLDMKNGKSWETLALAYLGLSGRDNILQAQKAIKMAIMNGLDKNADTLMNLGTVNELLANYNDALKNYEQAMVIVEGWALPAANLARLQEIISRSFSGYDATLSNKKLFNRLKGSLKNENDYLVVQITGGKTDPCPIAICYTITGEVRLIAVPQTIRAYLMCEKTVLTIKDPKWKDLTYKDRTLPYHFVENIRDIGIEHGSTPKDVKPVSISSSLA